MAEILLPNKEQIDKIIKLKSGIEPIFGVIWDKSSNPTLTRINDAIGMVANAGIDSEIVRNDFDNVPLFGEIHEVVDTLGNVFVRIPKFYIKKVDTENFKSWQVSKKRYPGFYLPWCFWDFENNKELPYVDIGKYKASLGAGNKLESKPNTYPLVNTNIVNMRNYARNNNVDGLKGYQQLDIHAVDVLRTLMIVEFATLNIQSIMMGFVNGRYNEADVATISESNTNCIIVSNLTASYYRVGQTISVGTSRGGNQIFYGRTITAIEVYDANNKAIYFDGEPVDISAGNILYNIGWKNGFSAQIMATSGCIIANDGYYPCHYRGIESPFGDIWQWVDGVNIDEHQAWVAKNAEDYTSNVFAHPYEKLGYVNSVSNGYIIKMGFDPKYPFAEFPVSVGGSNSTYYCDYYYQETGQKVALFGGGWYNGSSAGLSYWNLNNSSSSSSAYRGGRLLKKAL